MRPIWIAVAVAVLGSGCSLLITETTFGGGVPDAGAPPPEDAGTDASIDGGPAPVDGGADDAGPGDAGPPPAPCSDLRIVQLALGGNHTCVRHACGAVSCWGEGSVGQLGDGESSTSPVPVFVDGIADAQSIFAGDRFTCAVRSDATVWCWGANDFNGLGDGSGANQPTPVMVMEVTGAQELARGYNRHVCVSSTEDPNVFCWGENSAGEFGNGTALPSTVPVPVDTTLGTIESLGVGLHTCAVVSGGALFCWGGNGLGEVGDGTQMPRRSPTEVTGITAQQVAAGAGFTCIIDDMDEVRCWGNNRFGQLGDGTTAMMQVTATDSLVTARDIAFITAGAQHACALSNLAFALCWGRNNRGQLGLGTDGDTNMPTSIADLSNLTHIVAGNSHTCALRDDMAMFCWGANDFGQLGDGTTEDQDAPVRVMGLRTGS